MEIKQIILYLFCLVNTACLQQLSNEIASNAEEKINNYINSLEYNADKILAYKPIAEDIKAKTIFKEDKFTLFTPDIQQEDADISSFGIFSENNLMFPGQIFLADKKLIKNRPTVIPLPRRNLTYTIDLPGLESEASFTVYPSHSTYNGELNNVADIYFNKYVKDYDINAIIESTYSFVHSESQIALKFGSDFKLFSSDVKIDFNAVREQKKTVMIHKFKQIFYVVSVDPPAQPSDLFDASKIDLEDFKNTIGDDNVPVMVDSVAYGRIIYVIFETDSTDDNAKLILETKIASLDIDANAKVEYENHLKNLKMQAYVYGGTSKLSTGEEVTDSGKEIDFKGYEDLILNNGAISLDNLPLPVSYTCEFIKDNSVAFIQGNVMFAEYNIREFNSTRITIIHKDYTRDSSWEITWDEIHYDKDGHQTSTPKGWKRNGERIGTGIMDDFVENIDIPGNAKNLCVHVKVSMGLLSHALNSMLSLNNIPLGIDREFKVYGWLGPAVHITPEI